MRILMYYWLYLLEKNGSVVSMTTINYIFGLDILIAIKVIYITPFNYISYKYITQVLYPVIWIYDLYYELSCPRDEHK